MTNTNTNNDILELLQLENNNSLDSQIDVFADISLESEKLEINDIFADLSKEIEDRQIQEETIQNVEVTQSDILQEFETKNDVVENIEIKTEKNESILAKIWKNFIFFIKYIWTSTLIFAVLLSVTNYSAYIEIARSYLNPEALELNKQAMLASVQQSNIWTKNQDGVLEENLEENTTQKMEWVKNKTYHSMDKLINSTKNELDMNIEIVPYENRIVIPKIWKNIPLIEVQNKTVQNVKQLEDVFMKELVNWIVRYPWSARPWEIWNSFIFWHSSNFPWLEWKYNDVFALLDNVVFGDEIIAYYWQKKYTYKIKEKKVIKPGDVSVLKRNNDISEISLMTCWPVWTTLNRMIVVWELVKE